MKSLLEKQWFFGDVSAQEAQSLLGKGTTGNVA
jgi:hypothetical protein